MKQGPQYIIVQVVDFSLSMDIDLLGLYLSVEQEVRLWNSLGASSLKGALWWAGRGRGWEGCLCQLPLSLENSLKFRTIFDVLWTVREERRRE